MGVTSTSALAAASGVKDEPSEEASQRAASIRDTGFSPSHRHVRVWHKPSEKQDQIRTQFTSDVHQQIDS
jgi:hypothetical protein